jgi:hypothetical protein
VKVVVCLFLFPCCTQSVFALCFSYYLECCLYIYHVVFHPFLHPSQDTMCILSSLEVAHVELVLGRVGISRVHLEGKFLALIACRSLTVNGDQRQRNGVVVLLLVSRVMKSRLGRCHGQDFSCSREQLFEFKMNYAQKWSRF